MFFSIYGGETLFKVGQYVYGFKVVVSICWGSIVLLSHSHTSDSDTSTLSAMDEHFIALNFIQYVVITECFIWPIYLFKTCIEGKTSKIED